MRRLWIPEKAGIPATVHHPQRLEHMFMVRGVGGGHSSMKEGGREPVGPPLTSSTLRIGKQSDGSASLFHVVAVNCL